MMGFQPIYGDGKYVRVAILDSGCPIHNDISTDPHKCANFTTSGSLFDVYGHSTAIAGLIASKNHSLQGFAPLTDLYFGKCLLDSDGNGEFNSVIQSIFWAIVREVDIIVMAFGTTKENPNLHDAIKKANRCGIAIFAAAGNYATRTRDADFPARYDEVFSVGYANNITSNEVVRVDGKARGIVLPLQEFETTFVDSKFATMSGSSMHTAAVAGVAVLAFQKLRKNGSNIKNPQLLYDEIGRLSQK